MKQCHTDPWKKGQKDEVKKFKIIINDFWILCDVVLRFLSESFILENEGWTGRNSEEKGLGTDGVKAAVQLI